MPLPRSRAGGRRNQRPCFFARPARANQCRSRRIPQGRPIAALLQLHKEAPGVPGLCRSCILYSRFEGYQAYSCKSSHIPCFCKPAPCGYACNRWRFKTSQPLCALSSGIFLCFPANSPASAMANAPPCRRIFFPGGRKTLPSQRKVWHHSIARMMERPSHDQMSKECEP